MGVRVWQSWYGGVVVAGLRRVFASCEVLAVTLVMIVMMRRAMKTTMSVGDLS